MPQDKTILIVDDEPDLREILSYQLRQAGYRTLTAENGVEAFEIVLREKVDLIMADIQMPGGNGIQLLERVKARNRESPKVLLVTGFSDITLAEAYHRGAEGIILKPYQFRAYLPVIEKCLQTREAAWSARPQRHAVDLEISMKAEGADRTTRRGTGTVLNIGRGGIFVGLDGPLPRVNDVVYFSIPLERSRGVVIEGFGRVRWVRDKAEPGRPTGIGVEFVQLDEPSNERLVEFLDANQVRPYIPIT